MPYANFDRSQYPLIVIEFTGEKATDDSFDLYLKGLSENYEKGKNIQILFDAKNAIFPPLKYQMKQAKWLKENEQLMQEECSGIAYTIPNAVIRNALALIFKIQGQPVPYQVVSTNEKGIAWLSGLGK